MSSTLQEHARLSPQLSHQQRPHPSNQALYAQTNPDISKVSCSLSPRDVKASSSPEMNELQADPPLLPDSSALSLVRKRKLQIQEERALKKGLPLPHPGVDSTRTNSRYVQGTTKSPHPPTAARASLASKFIDLSPEFVLASRTTALTEPLPRPLPSGSSSFPRGWLDAGKGKAPMRVPMRPAWTYEMTKTEVEANEEEAHARWLAECAAIVDEWKHDGAERDATTWEQTADSKQTGRLNWPRSTTFYETNLQVWRQLWRTTEMSSILLVLLDIRCPPLHFPPSLQHYIASLTPQKQVVLVLTKCDLVPDSVKDAWVAWCKREWTDTHGWEVVEVESFKHETHKQGTQETRRSHIPPRSLSSLLSALQRAHSRLLQPAGGPEEGTAGAHSVRSHVDWEALHQGEGGDSPGGSSDDEHDSADAVGVRQPDFLTIGLIGQPNVGKSSLLNALVGQSKVRASKTPGKTKHFQTIFWSPEIRLCDTPGLVFPSLTTYELQALSTILPIAHIPALPAVIRLTACLMPLETILDLVKVVDAQALERERKKTYRLGTIRDTDAPKVESWTTGEILQGWAEERGYMTAQAGRPDLNRAGNQILRLIAEGQIPWSFLPPTSSPRSLDDLGLPDLVPERGIWLGAKPDRKHVFQDSSSEDESVATCTSRSTENDADDSSRHGSDDLGDVLDALNIEDIDSDEVDFF